MACELDHYQPCFDENISEFVDERKSSNAVLTFSS